MGWAVRGSSSRSPTQEVTSDIVTYRTTLLFCVGDLAVDLFVGYLVNNRTVKPVLYGQSSEEVPYISSHIGRIHIKSHP